MWMHPYSSSGPARRGYSPLPSFSGEELDVISATLRSPEGPGPMQWDRATVIHPRSLEVFESLGILEPFLDVGVKQRMARLLLVVRPDGYIGLRADQDHLDALAEYNEMLAGVPIPIETGDDADS